MNKHNIAQMEQEKRAVDAVINILLIFIFGLVAFSAGYFIAMSEAATLAGTM